MTENQIPLAEVKTASLWQERFTLAGKILLVMVAFFLLISTTVTDILLPVALLVFFGGGDLKNKFYSIIKNPIAICFLLFFALFIGGMFYSTAPWHDRFAMAIKYDKLLFGALLFPFFKERKWRDYAIWSYLSAIIIFLAFSFLKYKGLLHIYPRGGPTDVFKSYIETGALLGFAIYILLWKLFANPKCNWWMGIFVVIMSYYLFFLSPGRSGYATFAAMLILFLWEKLRFKGILSAIIGITILFGGAYFLSSTFYGRVNSAATEAVGFRNPTPTSVGARLNFALDSMRLIKSHPWVGTGTGSFKNEYANLTPPAKQSTVNPHDEYLLLGLQFGLIGIVLFLCLLLSEFYFAKFLDPESKFLGRALVVMMAVGCLANSWLMDTTEGHFFIYFSALFFANISIRSLATQENLPHPVNTRFS